MAVLNPEQRRKDKIASMIPPQADMASALYAIAPYAELAALEAEMNAKPKVKKMPAALAARLKKKNTDSSASEPSSSAALCRSMP